MFGILLVSFATLVGEVGQKLSKDELKSHRETHFGLAFLNGLWAISLLFCIVFFIPHESFLGQQFGQFTFDLQSLPTFLIRFILEIGVMYFFIVGLEKATRATFSFVRMITIPLLLLTDIALGYAFSLLEVISIGLIVFTIALLLTSHTLRPEGLWYVFVGSVLSVATISLYQYNITHYNSVAAEQLMMLFALEVYLFVATIWLTKKNPLRHLKRPRVFAHSFAAGVQSILTSYAYLYAPATIIVTAKRTSAILWAVLSGHRFYKERNLGKKLIGLGVISTGLVLLAFVN